MHVKGKKAALTALVAMMVTGPCLAADLTRDLGSLIAAGTTCGLVYDQAAVNGWIAKNAPADDMHFAPLLASTVHLAGLVQADMDATTKSAFCSQSKRVAETMGFLADH